MTSASDDFVPASQAELAGWMRDTALQQAGQPRLVSAVGGRTALHYGLPLSGPHQLVSTSKLTQIIDYPARDMTITVEAGLRVDELSAVLRRERQRLSVDIPQAYRATIGGAVACNASGPRRFALGTLRDYLIGVSAVDAAGRAYKAGGRVVKNVAGYDLCKLLIGSIGTLAVITQLTFKLKPQPDASAHLWLTFDTYEQLDQALERLLTSATRPGSLDSFDPRGAQSVASEARLDLPHSLPVLCIGIEGTEREVAWQVDTLRAELATVGPRSMTTIADPQSTALWSALIEFSVAADEPLTFKANLRPSQTAGFLKQAANAGVTLQAHAGNGIVIGHLPDDITSPTAARTLLEPLRSLARAGNGNLIVMNCDDAWKADIPVFGDPGPADHLMRNLKSKLDPQDRLNRGRMFVAR